MTFAKCTCYSDILQAKDYIARDYVKVPYLYTNLYKYGTGNENVEVWVHRGNGQIFGVYLRYFTCLHFYTKQDDYPASLFAAFVERNDPDVVMADDKYGEVIRPFMKPFLLSREYAFKYDLTKAEYSNLASYAKREDIEEIAELMMLDQLYQRMYTKQTLLAQLLERYDAGYGKCCIIRKRGRIVANMSINGENDKFVFLGSLIVHPEYRHVGLGGTVLKYLCKYARDNGLACLALVAEDNLASLELHKRLNAHPLGVIYKYRKM